MRVVPGILLGLFTVATLVAGCGDSDNAGDAAVSRQVADGWPVSWCKAEPKMNREQIVALMGPPTGSSATTMSWSAYQYQFNAFLAADGSVEQLDINAHSLSDREKSALTCAQVRTLRSQEAESAATPPPRPHTSAKACQLVSQAEMSAILGAPVVATPNDHSNGETKCIYKPATGISPYVEFSVAWGDGRAAMLGMGLAEQHEPGLTSPYDGIGDQAGAAGPALMIRTGEDLVTIVFSGVAEAPAAAKSIFETAKARM
ncbi:MAG: hypothetical protein ABI885_13910 [Gammaproteobacteria bacterium]